MTFEPLAIDGAYRILSNRFEDERGHFARVWCHEEFGKAGIAADMVQSSLSFNRRRGTLRGMHYQNSPHRENKLVRCIRGQIYDVVLDLRRDSPTYLQYDGVHLTAESPEAVFVPAGCAHGFITETDDSEILYMMDEFYHRESAAGVRWDDPAFGISWPRKIEVINERDATYPDYVPTR
ncbi:MAG: dTDP-4-dehydrorhamnose 3,5-epimerase [Rhodothermales bacterium]|nr:dTDP-4-dehydrorhamnose 3,5-epimerase [Rhodothermales bacterium]